LDGLDISLDEFPKLKALNDRQRAFVMAYHDCHNATAAAKQAGYSVRTAGKIGPRLTGRPNIKAALDELRDYLFRQQIMNKTEAAALLSNMARGRITDLLDENGEIDPRLVKQHGAETVKRIAREETKFGLNRELELHDPRAAIETLAKIMGWLKDERTVDLNGVSFHFDLSGSKA